MFLRGLGRTSPASPFGPATRKYTHRAVAAKQGNLIEPPRPTAADGRRRPTEYLGDYTIRVASGNDRRHRGRGSDDWPVSQAC